MTHRSKILPLMGNIGSTSKAELTAIKLVIHPLKSGRASSNLRISDNNHGDNDDDAECDKVFPELQRT